MIELRQITKTYGQGEIELQVLKGVDLTIGRGEFVALVGSSGSGKSTLMNLLGALDTPSSGEYFFDQRNVATLTRDARAELRSQKIGFVFQSFNLLPRTSALENVLMPLTYSSEVLSDETAALRAKNMLISVGLGDRMDHEPSQLSGGQQQRVAIARSLINNPSILLADEPTGNLDSKTTNEILTMFRKLNKENNLTIILVTHEPDVAEKCDRIITLKDGLVLKDEREGGAHEN